MFVDDFNIYVCLSLCLDHLSSQTEKFEKFTFVYASHAISIGEKI